MIHLKKISSTLLFVIFPYLLWAEGLVYCFWIPFTDKNDNEYNLSNPEAFLSVNTIERRKNYNIPIDELDLPVTKNYTDSLLEAGFTLQYSLRWFNGAVVYTFDSTLVKKAEKMTFVKDPKLIGLFDPTLKSQKNKFSDEKDSNDLFENTFSQIKLENGFFLHNKGYRGKEKTIAIIDAGFKNADFLPAFDSAWHNNQVLGNKDFSTFPQDIFNEHSHGMNVFSIIAGNIPDQLTGSAPDVSLWLLRSEVTAYEQPVEEYNWVAAAQFADSAGVDIINTSLGYSTFDSPFKSYTYSEMDGNTAIISKASAIAAKKGILCVTSAGNEGSDPWKYITAPADADNIIAVGATDDDGTRATFSSMGPSSDRRVKPDVMAMGQHVIIQNENNIVSSGSGTSFSSPVISGLAACLWQAFPDANNAAIRNAIIYSSSLYEKPDTLYGYGIPNFEEAWQFLNTIINNQVISSKIMNSVFDNQLSVEILSDNSNICQIAVYNTQGIMMYENQYDIFLFLNRLDIDLSSLPKGLYFLTIYLAGKSDTHKIIKLY